MNEWTCDNGIFTAHALKSWIFYFFYSIFFIFLSLKFVTFAEATPSSIEGPFIVNPPWSIGAPNDDIEFVLNITDDEIRTDKVFLLYSIKDIDENAPILEEEYESISMIEHVQNDTVRSWYCKLVPEENKKVIYFYMKIVDSLGTVSYHLDIENPAQFRILKPDPEFKIIFFNIESINEKQLTADITFSIEIYAGFDNPNVSFLLNGEHYQAERTDRFHFFEQMTIRDLPLNGDPTDFPFDSYELKLEFKTHFECEPYIIFENIQISNYNDRSIWTHFYARARIPRNASTFSR